MAQTALTAGRHSLKASRLLTPSTCSRTVIKDKRAINLKITKDVANQVFGDITNDEIPDELNDISNVKLVYNPSEHSY